MVIATCVLVLGSAVFVVICLAVKLTSRGSAFYSCERIGRNGRPFRCFKFRTMVADADESLRRILSASPALTEEFEQRFKLCRDPRVTRVGRVLRRISLDELPQFWNVLTGDMSVVGWRPIVPDEIPRYGDAFPFVSSLRPGITGLWQVSGRNDVTYDERVRLDVEYRTRPSLWADVSIMARTASAIAAVVGQWRLLTAKRRPGARPPRRPVPSRVVLVTNGLGCGGAEAQLLRLARMLVARGDEVGILSILPVVESSEADGLDVPVATLDMRPLARRPCDLPRAAGSSGSGRRTR